MLTKNAEKLGLFCLWVCSDNLIVKQELKDVQRSILITTGSINVASQTISLMLNTRSKSNNFTCNSVAPMQDRLSLKYKFTKFSSCCVKTQYQSRRDAYE